jgi:hypothetical protein
MVPPSALPTPIVVPNDRPYLRTLLTWGITALIVFIGARYGINIPPPPLPIPESPNPDDPIPQPPGRQPNVSKAIGRIQFGNAGCTATPIGDRMPDGRYRILTAAHCNTREGQRGTFRGQNGETLSCTVVARNPSADCSWLISDSTNVLLPFAELADDPPAPGTKIWHQGYGVHNPGNREEGEFVGGPDGNGQLRFNLSVSSGDSGGAIVIEGSNRVLSCVCCTERMAVKATVWGPGPVAIASLRRTATDDWVWTPLPVPLRGKPEKMP